MDGLATAAFWIAVGLTLAFSYLATWCARWAAPRLGLIDLPDGGRKQHRRATPLMGGVAVYLALLGAVVYNWASGASWLADDVEMQQFCKALLVCGALFCGIGLWDDWRPMRARTKFFWQVAAAAPFVYLGQSVESVQVFGGEFKLGAAGAIFAIGWLVICANVVNLLDGLDGLAGSVGVVVALTVAVLACLGDRTGVMAISIFFAAAVAGFLIHNWPPARIFLGDAGSLTIGFTAGALALQSSMKTPTAVAFVAPLIIMSVPIFDTVLAIVRRKMSGRGIGEADHGHIHHRLQARGLSRSQTLLTIVTVCVTMALAATGSAVFSNDFAAILMCGSIFVVLIGARVFGYHETVLFFRHAQAVGAALADSSHVLHSHLLRVRVDENEHDRDIERLWRGLTRNVERLGAGSLEFTCRKRGEDQAAIDLDWEGNETHISASDDEKNSAGDNGASWRFQYAIVRDDGLRAMVRVRGVANAKPLVHRLDDLYHLFESFCRQWPLDAAGAPSSDQENAQHEETQTIPLRPAA